MPGLTQGRTSRSSRRNGWKPSGSVRKRAGKAGVGVDVGDQPGLGRVGEEAVGEQHDRGHVVDGDAHRLARHGEAVGRRGGGQDDDRRVAVAAHHRLVEVGLLGLGRQAGGRAAALGVDDHQRQLGGDGEADGLGLERDAGAGAGGDAEAAGVGGADGGAGGGDLVLGLEGGDADGRAAWPDGAAGPRPGVIG